MEFPILSGGLCLICCSPYVFSRTTVAFEAFSSRPYDPCLAFAFRNHEIEAAVDLDDVFQMTYESP